MRTSSHWTARHSVWSAVFEKTLQIVAGGGIRPTAGDDHAADPRRSLRGVDASLMARYMSCVIAFFFSGAAA